VVSTEGRVVAVCLSPSRGTKKKSVESITLVENHGVLGDAHAGKWHRQVSMLSVESIEKMKRFGIKAGFGDFAENITTEGLTLHSLPVGTRLRVGEAVLEITQIGKECHSQCEIARSTGICIMPAEGIFLRVLKGGIVKPGDKVIVEKSGE